MGWEYLAGDLTQNCWGLIVGLLSFLMVFSFSVVFLHHYGLLRKGVLNAVLLSGLGHFIGGLAYYWFSVHVGSDSDYYFKNATTQFKGFGYEFAFYVLGYLKEILFGDSILAAFLFFSSLSFLGSLFYLLAYKILLDKILNGQKYYLIDKKILYFPALLLLCWPSYFFWGAGLVKDSFAFLSIGIFLFFIAEGRISFFRIVLLVVGVTLGFLVRPYLCITIGITSFMYVLLGSQWNIFVKIVMLALIFFGSIIIMPTLTDYATTIHFSSETNTLSNYAIRQQTYMNIGTSMPIPTHNPHLLWLFLPYLIIINLFFPLFFSAWNMMGLASSMENLYLISWFIFFFKNIPTWKKIKEKSPITTFFIIFSMVGMSFLSIMNTNLGLAMREKMMYVPAFLIIIFLVFAYRRTLMIQEILQPRS